jgi:hypothetical protein
MVRFSKIAGWSFLALRGELNRLVRRPVRVPATSRQALESWLAELGSLPVTRGRILVTALRNHTWIEWAAYSACVFRKMGFTTTLLYRSSEIRRLYNEPAFLNFWKGVQRIPEVECLDLDAVSVKAVQCAAFDNVADEAAAYVVAYDNHVEEADVRADAIRFGSAVGRARERLRYAGAALSELLRHHKFDRFLCYSGLIGDSPALLASASRAGLETICLEGWAWRPGHMICNRNAPALEYNIAGWLRRLGPWDASKEREVNDYLKFLDGENRTDSSWLDNFYRIQRDRVAEALPAYVRKFVKEDAPIFLLAPNVIGDSSMLRRETIFPGQQIWAREVIQWFAARPQLKLIVRAHPAERWVGSKCMVHMGPLARREAKGAPNILILDSEDTVNTFALLPFARAGLAWLSSAAVDFVVRGVPTMVAARPKYAAMGIVYEPTTRQEYFAQLERWKERAERPSPESVSQGKRYLHVVFKGFSFEAGARNYRATDLRLNRMPSQTEHDTFYRILLGDDPMPDKE